MSSCVFQLVISMFVSTTVFSVASRRSVSAMTSPMTSPSEVYQPFSRFSPPLFPDHLHPFWIRLCRLQGHKQTNHLATPSQLPSPSTLASTLSSLALFLSGGAVLVDEREPPNGICSLWTPCPRNQPLLLPPCPGRHTREVQLLSHKTPVSTNGESEPPPSGLGWSA